MPGEGCEEKGMVKVDLKIGLNELPLHGRAREGAEVRTRPREDDSA